MKDAKIHCGYCRKQLVRKRFNGRLEDRSIFLRRKYCNRECFARGMLKDDATKSALMKRANKLCGEHCEACGTQNRIGTHHRDGNIRNNSKKNRMTLCPTCHTKWHWENGKTMPKRSRRTCSVCGKRERTHAGLCGTHYQRQRKYGDPHLTQKLINGSWQLVKDLSTGRNHNRPAVSMN